jgi:putative NADH-flavin reductase
MKIAVVAANGKAGKLIVEEAVNRGNGCHRHCQRRKQDCGTEGYCEGSFRSYK